MALPCHCVMLPGTVLQVHTYRAKPPPATPDILKCVLELLLALSDSPDLRQMHAKVPCKLLILRDLSQLLSLHGLSVCGLALDCRKET